MEFLFLSAVTQDLLRWLTRPSAARARTPWCPRGIGFECSRRTQILVLVWCTRVASCSGERCRNLLFFAPRFSETLIKSINTRIPIALLDRQGHHRTQLALFGERYDMDLPPPPSADPPAMSSAANRPYVPEISRDRIVDLVAAMNRVGFAVLSGDLEPAHLEDLRQFVETAVAAAGGEDLVVTGEGAGAGG